MTLSFTKATTQKETTISKITQLFPKLIFRTPTQNTIAIPEQTESQENTKVVLEPPAVDRPTTDNTQWEVINSSIIEPLDPTSRLVQLWEGIPIVNTEYRSADEIKIEDSPRQSTDSWIWLRAFVPVKEEIAQTFEKILQSLRFPKRRRELEERDDVPKKLEKYSSLMRSLDSLTDLTIILPRFAPCHIEMFERWYRAMELKDILPKKPT